MADSDNTAINAIQANLPGKIAVDDESINFLDLQYQVTGQKNVIISPHTSGPVLKCLYFSCYLGLDNSQAILKDLTESNYNNRLVRGLPQGVLIAHKIGTNSKTNQSDCGIAYVPLRNYILSIMVYGPDPQGNSDIADISKIDYDFISGIQLSQK